MKNPIFRVRLLMIVGLVLSTTPLIVRATVDANTTGTPWLWTPYSVGLCLVADDSVADRAAIERNTLTALLRWQSNWLNGICDFQPEPPPIEVWSGESGVITEFPPSWEQHDKLFLIAVTHRDLRLGGNATVGWSATISEWDLRTRNFGENRRVDVAQLSQLPEHLFYGITEMLTPLARVVRVDENRILLEERAGELLAMQDVLPVATSRQVMLPVMRTNDRDGHPLDIRRMDWTFLEIDQNSNGLLSTTMHTGLRSPINARVRPRHWQLALLAKPSNDHTTIRFVSYLSPNGEQDRDMPLPICDILESVPGIKQAVLIGSTDSRGEFRIGTTGTPTNKPVPGWPVRLLYVRNGRNLIARIPVMPGIEPVLTAQVPIADATLHAESLVLGIQEEILDTVALRQILVSQAITFRQRSDRRGFDDTIIKLRRLKTREVYQAELSLLKMQLPDDPISRRRIETMLEQTHTLVQDSLPPVEVPWTTR